MHETLIFTCKLSLSFIFMGPLEKSLYILDINNNNCLSHRFSEDEIDEMLQDCPVDKKGNIDYVTYTQILKRGKKDEEEDQQPPK